MGKFCSASCRSRGVYEKTVRHLYGPGSSRWPRISTTPLGKRASARVAYALRAGYLTRKPCERCGAEKVHAHHEDYTKPLDVMWLCQSCHMKHHLHGGAR
jgi:ribosomal protein S27AE